MRYKEKIKKVVRDEEKLIVELCKVSLPKLAFLNGTLISTYVLFN